MQSLHLFFLSLKDGNGAALLFEFMAFGTWIPITPRVNAVFALTHGLNLIGYVAG